MENTEKENQNIKIISYVKWSPTWTKYVLGKSSGSRSKQKGVASGLVAGDLRKMRV